MRNALAAAMVAATMAAFSASEPQTLWNGGNGGSMHYRIVGLCTAPNGDLVAVCDARRGINHDLCFYHQISLAVRRSTDGGKTWTPSASAWDWPWEKDGEQWSEADPSLVVDAETQKIFLFGNVIRWERSKRKGDQPYRHFVQESADNGATWSKPREITSEIAFPEWPFGKPTGIGRPDAENAQIFIPSGSGTQLRDGTLLHTICRVGLGIALIGSVDHGRSWKRIGRVIPCKGDECKVVELGDGTWMINLRRDNGRREVFRSVDRGETWQATDEWRLEDPMCNAQLKRFGDVLLFSNCKAPFPERRNLTLCASLTEGRSWGEGVTVCAGGSMYSDFTRLANNDVGVLYEEGPYSAMRILFRTIPWDEIVRNAPKGPLELGAPFADGCVLQRQKPIPVWGWAAPGAKVTVSFNGAERVATADATGDWKAVLPASEAVAEPKTLTVTAVSPAGGTETVRCADVVVGEVWFASGQSNMELPLWSVDPHRRDRDGILMAQRTVKPHVRFLKAPNRLSTFPVPTLKAAWRHAVPEEIIRRNEWAPSAIGFYFATQLEDAIRVPVGIVEADWGGTDIDAWTPPSGLVGKKGLEYDGKLHGGDTGPKQQPHVLWNGMVAAFTNMAFRGVLWYQGCQNIFEPERYAAKMRALYDGWTIEFGFPAMPFYFSQLASFGDEACRDILIMEAQQEFAESEKNAGMAVICDHGNIHDCHPNEKEIVARRLLSFALRRQYGFASVNPDPPVVTDFRKDGAKVTLTFDARGRFWYQYRADFGVESGIELCGADGVWHPAVIENLVKKEAKAYGSRGIIGACGRLTVSAKDVADPKGIRYLRSGDRRATLYAEESNLPLGPFSHTFR